MTSHNKHNLRECPPINGKQETKDWEDYWEQGHGASRDICTHTQGPDPSQGSGWQDTYRCYLGSTPSSELIKKYGKIPACYDGTGKPSHAPSPALPTSNTTGGSSKIVPTTTNQCSGLIPFGDNSTGSPAILSDIKYFQDQEMKILDELQTESVKVSPDENKINTMIAQLKPFQDSRVRLMAQLSNIASQSQCSLASDRRALQDQLTMTSMADEQLKSVEQQTQDIINERNNKQRMVEITNYEYDRYSSHKNIFKIIAFCSLFVLAGIYIGATQNSTFSWLGYPIVVISIAVAVFLTIKRIYDNHFRDERNWKQFVWDSPQPHGQNYETVWQHDKRAFDKAWSDTKYEAGRAEEDADNIYNKAKTNALKAYSDAKKDISKTGSDISGDLAISSKKGQNQLSNKSTGQREQFTNYT